MGKTTNEDTGVGRRNWRYYLRQCLLSAAIAPDIPEIRLWVHVLTEAVHDAVKEERHKAGEKGYRYASGCNSYRRAALEKAADFVFGTGGRDVCDVIGVEPEYFRRLARPLIANAQALKQHPRALR